MAFWDLYFLEWLTGAIAMGGLTVGVYSFINPRGSARIYGIPTYDLANDSNIGLILGTRTPLQVLADRSARPGQEGRLPAYSFRESGNENLAMVHSLGVRNLTAGLTIFVLTMYWHELMVKSDALSLLSAMVVQRVLGQVILIGALVPVVDAWVCLRHSRDVHQKRIVAHEQEVKAGTSRGGLWQGEGCQADLDTYVTAKRAGQLHLARCLVWIAGGLYCLYW